MTVNLNYLSNGMLEVPEERKKLAYNELEREIQDYDIQEFLKEYNLTEDQEFLKRNATRIMDYIFNRENNEFFIPTLQLINNTMHITLVPRNEVQRRRMSNGERAIARAYYDEITINYSNVKLDRSLMTTQDMNVLKAMKQFLDNYKPKYKNKGIWLYGSYGVGKTYLMGYFVEKLVERGIEVRFISLTHFMDKLMQSVRVNGNNLDIELKKLKKVECLIIDDVGAEYIKHWGISKFYEVLDYRMNNNKATHFTSNYNIDDYLNSMNSIEGYTTVLKGRLRERLTVLANQIQMTGSSKRHI